MALRPQLRNPKRDAGVVRGANGLYTDRIAEKDIPIKLGPSGGYRSKNSVNWDDGVHQKIEKIIIGYSDQVGIYSIQGVYSDADNIQIHGRRHGGNDTAGTSFKVINITKPVTRIDATYTSRLGTFCGITSLEFSSSEGSYGLYGKKSDGSFKFECDLGFSGFHGHADHTRIYTLGVYIKNTSGKKYLSPCSN